MYHAVQAFVEQVDILARIFVAFCTLAVDGWCISVEFALDECH